MRGAAYGERRGGSGSLREVLPVTGEDFVMYAEDVEAMDAELGRFLEESEAQCCLLVHRHGQLVAKRGHTQQLDTTSLAALAAGAFASTKEIARLVGEPEFSVLFHEGVDEHIHVSLVAEHMILVSIFDDRTTIGMVRLYAAEAAQRLGEVVERMKARESAPLEGLETAAGQTDLFAPEPGAADEEATAGDSSGEETPPPTR